MAPTRALAAVRAEEEKRKNNLQTIWRASEAIRKKYAKLKQLNSERSMEHQNYLRPIVEPLELLSNRKFIYNVDEDKLYNITDHEAEKITIKKQKHRHSTPERKINDKDEFDYEDDYNDDNYEDDEPKFDEEISMIHPSISDSSNSRIARATRKIPPAAAAAAAAAAEKEEIYQTEPGLLGEAGNLETTIHSMLETPEGNEQFEKFAENNLGPISKKYIRKIFKDKPGKIDHTYGPYFHGNKMMIGDFEMELESDDKIILKKGNNKVRYKATPGLFELIVSSAPNDNLYDENDLLRYASIIHRTNAARRDYNESSQLKGSKSSKWKNILRPMFAGHTDVRIINNEPVTAKKHQQQSQPQRTTHSSSSSSSGGMDSSSSGNLKRTQSFKIPSSAASAAKHLRRTKSLKPTLSSPSAAAVRQQQQEGSGINMQYFPGIEIDYVHWDDPNELVERLRLLMAEHKAGHTNHNNEIISIIEELREANIIE